MAIARHWRVHIDRTNGGVHAAFAEVIFRDVAGTDLSVGGTAIASSAYSADFAASKAFDKDTSVASRWATAVAALPGWIGYIHPIPVQPASVRLYCDNDPNNGVGTLPPTDAEVAVEYSIDDGATWRRMVWRRTVGAWGNGAVVDIEIDHTPVVAILTGRQLVIAGSPAESGSLKVAAPMAAIDVEFGGRGRIFGTTKLKGTTENLPVKARVVLHHQRSRLPVRQTWSDPVTGDFSFDEIDVNQEYFVMAEDAAGQQRAVAAQRLVPEEMP